jgi:hypothetical protein
MCLVAATLAGTSSPAMSQTETYLTLDAQALASPNPFLIPGPDRGAVLTQISASPEIKLTSDTGSSLDLNGTVTQKWFSRHYGHFLVGKFDAAGKYRSNEYLTVEADGGFSRDLAVDVLTSSIDAVIDPQSIRTDYDGAFRLRWTPDAHTEIVPEVRYEASDYSDSTLLRNTRTFKAGLAVSRRISPYTQIGVRAEALFNKAAGSVAENSQALYATLKQDITEHWQLTAEIGAERTENRAGPLQEQTVSPSSPTRLSGRAELCRKVPNGLACLAGLIDSEISGLGGLQRTMTGSATIMQKLSERTSVNGVVEYRHSETQRGAFPGLDSLRATLKLDRRIGRAFTLSATAQYLRRQLVDGGWIGAAYGGLQLRFQPRQPNHD